MKGIILAGGLGSRLYPVSKAISKQLIPIYDKPMIFYPLSVLMLAGIKEILIISSPNDIGGFVKILGNGKNLGLNIHYKTQIKPNGIAESFLIGENFIGNSRVVLILGDNLFFGNDFSLILKNALKKKSPAMIFGYKVKNPSSFGVVQFKNDKILSIEEKPLKPKSDYAVTGLYIYDNEVVEIAKKLKKSNRGELEITDINLNYLKRKKLNITILGRGFAWMDTGTFGNLLEASIFVQTIERTQGNKIACLEEIAYNNRWINKKDLLKIASTISNLEYRAYLKNVAQEKF